MLKGIDVSRWQGAIDWQAVHVDNAFAFLRATDGYNRDALLNAHRPKVIQSGLAWGCYHYFRPTLPGLNQAHAFCLAAGPFVGQLPPILDLEERSAPTDMAQVLAWLSYVESLSKTPPIIYTGPDFATNFLKGDVRLARYPLWVAQYTSAAVPTVPSPWKNWLFWQNSGHGHNTGVTGNVDTDLFNGDQAALEGMIIRDKS